MEDLRMFINIFLAILAPTQTLMAFCTIDPIYDILYFVTAQYEKY